MKITNNKLVKLLKDKDELVKVGRNTSKQIEKLDAKIKICEDKERGITEKVEPKELGDKTDKLQAEIQAKIKQFEKLAKEIMETKLKAIPASLEKEHKDLLAEKEKLERERNKIALKVQKIKDKAVPIIKKEVAPLLKEYEDIESAEVKGDAVVIKVFSHLEEFKARFNKKK